MYPELYKCNSRESTFVEFCVDGNNFIDSLGPGRDSNPYPSALKPSECTTTPLTSPNSQVSRAPKLSGSRPAYSVYAKVNQQVGRGP
jgi:hypothetical protein